MTLGFAKADAHGVHSNVNTKIVLSAKDDKAAPLGFPVNRSVAIVRTAE